MKKTTFLIYVLLLFSGFSCFAQPANDNCSGAIELFPDQFACSNSLVTVILDNTATDSGSPADPGCAAYSGGASDLWYKLVMPSTGGVRIETSEGTIDDNGMAIYTGSCGNLELYGCNDDGNGVDQLMATYEVAIPMDEIIYIRVWAYGGAQTGNFSICTVEIPVPPIAVNDDCIDATILSLNTSCSITLGSNNATNSENADATIPAPSCADSYFGRDVWYKFTVPSTGQFAIETSNNDGSISDTAMSLYSGSCGVSGLTEISCNDDIGGGNTFSRIEETFSAGADLFVRVWSHENFEIGTFNICAVELPSLSTGDIQQNNFLIYPNPVNDIINIKFSNGNKNNIDVQLYNIQGKLVLSTSEVLINNQLQLNVSSMKSGMYFLKVLNDDSEITKKIIVR